MGKQLTDVVETANARTSANRTFPPGHNGKACARAAFPAACLAETAETPAGAGSDQNLLRHLSL